MTDGASGSRSPACRRSSRRSTWGSRCLASGRSPSTWPTAAASTSSSTPPRSGCGSPGRSARDVVERAELVMAAAARAACGAPPGDPRDRLPLLRDGDRGRRSRGRTPPGRDGPQRPGRPVAVWDGHVRAPGLPGCPRSGRPRLPLRRHVADRQRVRRRGHRDGDRSEGDRRSCPASPGGAGSSAPGRRASIPPTPTRRGSP